MQGDALPQQHHALLVGVHPTRRLLDVVELHEGEAAALTRGFVPHQPHLAGLHPLRLQQSPDVVLGGCLGQHSEHDDGAGTGLLLGRLGAVILVPIVPIRPKG